MFRSIVVGTDGSDTATEAVRQAVEIAKAVGARSELVIVSTPLADQRLPLAPEHLAISPRQGAEAALAEAAELARQAGVAANTHARQGDAASVILRLAEEQEAGLVIVGNQAMSGPMRFLLGSVPNKVSHHAPCSVLIIRTS